MSKRKENVGEGDVGDLMELTPLGAGQEVGRSCLYMTFKGKTIMFDCGVHPAYSGYNSLPMIDDDFDLATVDLLLVTHFHLDHCASLPYILYKTNFKGRVFMTHPTKAIYHMMLSDFIRVSKVAVNEMLFDEQDLKRSMDRIEVLDFHQEMEVSGVSFWAYHAGHVLGAAMFMVDIAGTRLLYTGDYSREEDRHLKAAEMPEVSPDVVVIESTYGVQSHQPRKEREARFVDVIRTTILRGGRVLIPTFALGRAQELLLILEEYWAAHPEMHNVPIYYASPLAKRCMKAYQTYINSMNDKIRQQYDTANPFEFKHIHNLKSLQEFDDTGPSVVMASPGMLQSGMSRQLFDMWCQDARNACVIAGYCVEGTLAKFILTEPKEVTLMSGLVVPLEMSVHYISFSAHADYTQTAQFLSTLRAPNVVLMHGEANEMGRLKAALQHKFTNENFPCQIMNPKNCQTVQFRFKAEKVARAVGSLVAAPPKEGARLSGLLVQKGFGLQLLAPSDLRVYTQLTNGSVLQRQSVPYSQGMEVLASRLEQIFDAVSIGEKRDLQCVHVSSVVSVLQQTADYVVVEWSADPIADMVADSVLATLLQLDEDPSTVRRHQRQETGAADGEVTTNEDRDLVATLLQDIFGSVMRSTPVSGTGGDKRANKKKGEARKKGAKHKKEKATEEEKEEEAEKSAEHKKEKGTEEEEEECGAQEG
eukprot:CAMPEP_0198208964 /NCGR_PEP_ID=MMETSP1445-20131203/12302_1 /TAXON_ID=36898 /ORGANISM="Pyramimonas sp., Strain CCMP2087" /LENGTH=702 /DNA_ID=CAMNT_0043882573 /DNA_START=71 /DNA_END=2176 /DNA_ORIENTATION=-